MTQDELKVLVEYRNGALYWIKPTSNRVKIGDWSGHSKHRKQTNEFQGRVNS